MKKRIVSLLMICAALSGLALSGCGGASVTPPAANSGSGPASATLSGVAASGAAIHGIVSLKDSSGSAVLTTWTAADGSYAFDVSARTAPFVLKVEWAVNGAAQQLYSFSTGAGIANINPLSNVALAAAAVVSDPATLFANPDPAAMKNAATNLPLVIDSLKSKIAPLLTLYGVTQNPVTDTFVANSTGLDAMFDNVQISLSGGMILVTNPSTMGQIFSASVTNIAGGTFNAGNMPSMPLAADGGALYTANCSGCHGPLATSAKKNATAAMIQTGISTVGAMSGLSSLTTDQITAIATALGGTMPTPTPPPTLAPFDGAAFYTANCSGCHGPLATSSKLGATAAMIQSAISSNLGGMGQFSTLTTGQINAIATALAGTTPTPTPPPVDGAGLYGTYCSGCHGPLATSAKLGATATMIQTGISSVGAMSSLSSLTNSQIDAIATALTVSTPTPTPPPTDGATLYTTYCSGCHGPLATSSKLGATATMIQTGISSVSAMSSLSVLTTTQIQAIATALTSTPVPTDGASLYTIYCSGCHGSLSRSEVRGATASEIQAEISSNSRMSSLSILTTDQIRAIASAL